MRLPTGSIFVDGTPDGGTIVRAAFLNAVLGELVAILALGGIQPLASGDLPEDHHQIADLLAGQFLRSGESPPTGATLGAVWVRPSSLLSGEWPFYVHDGVEFQPAPNPIPELPDPVDPSGPSSDPVFNDLRHGQRGGGDLHSLATNSVAGFMAPTAVTALQDLIGVQPRVFRSEIFEVTTEERYELTHNLGRIPDHVLVLFAPTGDPVRIVNSYQNADWEWVGATIEVSSTAIVLQTGEHVWGGLEDNLYIDYEAGNYRVIALAFG